MKLRKNICRRCSVALAFAAILWCSCVASALTLDECQQLAAGNYPLLKRYDLIRATTDYTVRNASKGYLPQITVGAQATLQSDVMALPDAMNAMLAASGAEVKGLKKDQYRVSVDVNQVIYDGGNIKSAKQVAEAEGEVRSRRNDVEIYALRDRVNNLFFGILITDEQLGLNREMQALLSDNCRKLEAMVAGGVAMQSDADAVRAEYLSTVQQYAEIESVRRSYCSMLEIFIGNPIDTALEKPEVEEPLSAENNRPELRLFDAHTAQLRARMGSIDAGVRPRLSLFAQGYYGYPGLNTFEDMMEHRWTLNGIVGVRLSWNIGNFYTRRNDKNRLAVAMNEVDNSRELFLFNNRLQSAEERSSIDRYRTIMKHDDDIIALRTSVRQSAESKLEHGIIDVNELLQEITRENTAKINRSTHEIELLKSIAELKNTLNR